MTDDEIRGRARRASGAFLAERDRLAAGTPMRRLLECYRSIAAEVARGEYHREGIFRTMVRTLDDMGFDVSYADTEARERSGSVLEAAENAVRDTIALYHVALSGASEHRAAFDVVSSADDLMHCARDTSMDIDRFSEVLHEMVGAYLGKHRAKEPAGSPRGAFAKLADALAGKGTPEEVLRGRAITVDDAEIIAAELRRSHEIARPICGDLREVPERVIFRPPATIAFWPDGTKTVAKCAEGDEFSEYVGLVVCMAKRHTRIPRHRTFEDVMARLLKRAERQRPKAKGAKGKAKAKAEGGDAA